MSDPPTTSELVSRQDAARLTRLMRVLERQSDRPETMAGFFSAIGAQGVVAALAKIAFGPQREDITSWDRLPELLRRGLYSAATWPEFDAGGFGADLAELLREDDEDRRATVSAVTAFLLTSGQYDERMLSGWSKAFDELTLPAQRSLRWSTFLTGTDGPQPWDGLASFVRAIADSSFG